MTQLLSRNRLWLCEAEKARAEKKNGTYPKSADPKVTGNRNLTYHMKHMAQFLPDDTTEKSGTKLCSAL